jgi:Flp pilus assembly pilin Flp
MRVPLRRLASDISGQAVVTYAIIACLLAAALVVGTSVWTRDSLLADRGPAAEAGR